MWNHITYIPFTVLGFLKASTGTYRLVPWICGAAYLLSAVAVATSLLTKKYKCSTEDN